MNLFCTPLYISCDFQVHSWLILALVHFCILQKTPFMQIKFGIAFAIYQVAIGIWNQLQPSLSYASIDSHEQTTTTTCNLSLLKGARGIFAYSSLTLARSKMLYSHFALSFSSPYMSFRIESQCKLQRVVIFHHSILFFGSLFLYILSVIIN